MAEREYFEDDEKNKKQPVDLGTPLDGSMPTVPGTQSIGRTGFGGMNLDFAGQRSPMSATGFNMERALAGGDPDSVKDGFLRTVMGLDLDLRGLDKAQTGDVLRSQLLPALQQQGIQARMGGDEYDILEFLTNERGWEPIDVVKNAGGDAEWAWQDDPFAPQVQGGLGGPMAQLQGMPGGNDILSALLADGGLQGSGLLEQIQAELQKLLAGQAVSEPQGLLLGGGDAPLF